MWLEEIGVTERLVFYVFCAAASLNVVLALAVLVVGCIYRVVTPGASLDFYIAFGSLALMVAALIRGADPEWGTIADLEALCHFFPCILTFGLLWFVGGLLLKACAIFDYFKNHSGDGIRRHEWKPNMIMIILMLIDAAIVMVWLLMFEPHLKAKDLSGNYLNMSLTLPEQHFFECTGDRFSMWMLVVSAFHAFLLLIAAVIVWFAWHQSRRTPASAESTLLSIAIYFALFGAIGATVVHFYYDGPKSINYSIVGGIIFVVIFVTLLLILIMKVVASRRSKHSRGSDSVYDKVDDDRGRYRNDSYVDETRLPKKKTKKEKKKKEKKPKKTKSVKSSRSKRSSRRRSDEYQNDNYENDRYESERYDDYDDRQSYRDRDRDYDSRDRRSNRGSYYNDSQRGRDNKGYESNRTSKIYNDSRDGGGSERSRDRSPRGSYRGEGSYRGSDRGSNRQSEVFAY